MHPQLQVMLAAQELERELKILKNQMEAVSIPLEKVKARRQAMRRDLLALKDKLEKTLQERRQAENQLSELDEKLKQARVRLGNARNPKEAQALEQEIERAETAATKAEETALDLMEREETLGQRLESETARVTRDLEAVIDPEIKRLSGMLEEQMSLANDLREERIAAVNRMDEETREIYEWLVRKHGPASAIAEVKGAACGGCGAMLLPDQVMKVRNSQDLHRCDHCYRYLIMEQ